MRFDLRLHGRTDDGRECLADISVYARSQKQLRREAHSASENAPWRFKDGDGHWVPDGGKITVEHVESLTKPKNRERPR